MLTDGSHTFRGPSGAAMMRVVFEQGKAKKAIRVPCTTASAAEAYLWYQFGPVNVIQCDEPQNNPEFGVTLSLADGRELSKTRKIESSHAAWLREKSEEVMHGDSLAAGLPEARKGPKAKSR